MKPTSSFKISKQYKRTAASILCSHERGAYLRAMVSAQLEEESARRQPLNKKDKQ
jgi:hypothetical protein